MKYFNEDPGYLANLAAANRAVTYKTEGPFKYVVDPKLLGTRLAHGAVGAALLGSAGLLINRRFPAAPSLGIAIGSVLGYAEADRKYLDKKGIQFNPFIGTVNSMTPEAKLKYLSSSYKGGGY